MYTKIDPGGAMVAAAQPMNALMGPQRQTPEYNALSAGGGPTRAAAASLGNSSDDPRLAAGILETANALGMDPMVLATIISYETGGTFDPNQPGPTTQYGQHRGLIQFGEPQAREYGVDWDNPVGSQLGPDGAIAKYFRQAGYEPGMGIMDAYSAVNAGHVGRYGASDANNGGAPGTVRDKVTNQMAGHRQNATRMMGN